MRWRALAKSSQFVVASLAMLLAMAVALRVGIIDRFASDGSIDTAAAIGALTVYWFLGFAIVWVIPNALRRRQDTALVAVSTVIALILLEIGCRLFVPGTTAVRLGSGGIRSRQFHHGYPARAHVYMGRLDGHGVFVDTNEDGLRTAYSKKDFTTFQHRVVVLGDSFTFGLGVSSESSFPQRLENNLRHDLEDRSIAVLNAGIVSYSPFLEKLLLERKLADYRPTLVVLFLDATDIGDDYQYMNEYEQSGDASTFALEDGSPPTYHGALYELTRPYGRRMWFLMRYPFRVAQALAGGGADVGSPAYNYYAFKVTVAGTLEKNRFFIYRHPLDDTRSYFDRTLRNVDEIASLAARMGAGFALFVTPRFHHWNARESPDNWEKGSYELNEAYQYEYFRYFDESVRSYPIINLLPDFQATGKYPLVFPNDPHWNAAGHAFVADAVTRHMLKRRLIHSMDSPPSPR